MIARLAAAPTTLNRERKEANYHAHNACAAGRIILQCGQITKLSIGLAGTPRKRVLSLNPNSVLRVQ